MLFLVSTFVCQLYNYFLRTIKVVLWWFSCLSDVSLFKLAPNGLQLQEVGDFYRKYSYEAHTSNIKQTFIRSTISPIYCRCCYRLAFLSFLGYNHLLSRSFVSFVECFFVWLVRRVFYFFEAL